MRAARRDTEAHADLTVADLPEGAGVLSLHSDRVLALLGEAGVVEDPRVDWISCHHLRDGVAGGESTHVAIAPVRIGEEVKQSLVSGVGQAGIGAGPRRDRLDALALAVAEQAKGIGRKRDTPLLVPQEVANATEILCEPTLPIE